MTRLVTNGAEWRSVQAEDPGWPDRVTQPQTGSAGENGNEQTIVHSPGGSSVKVSFNPSPFSGIRIGAEMSAAIVTGRRYYMRGYIYMDSTFTDLNPTPVPYVGVLGLNALQTPPAVNGAATAVITTANGGATPAGRLGLFVNQAGVVSQIGAYTSALALNTWHCIELSWLENASGTVELRLNGTVVASGTATVKQGIAANNPVGLGFYESSSNWGANSGHWYFDDFAVNDDQGSDQNGYPGEGFVYLLTPTSDQGRSGWTGGAGGTTNLWDAVNNLPPVGVIATLTNTSQIANVVKATTENYDGLCPTYASVMGSGETVKCAAAVCNNAENPTTGTKAGVVHILSNPAQAEPAAGARGSFNFGGDGGAPVGAYPANGWTTFIAPYVYSGFTAGTAPVVRVGKRTSSSNAVYVDSLGIIFETSLAVVRDAPPPRVISQAVKRSALWMKRRSGIAVPRLWTPADVI